MPAGRPKKQIDQKQFEKLCGLQCTLEELCCYFDCNTDTIEKWCKKTYHKNFSEVFKLKRGNGKISLRRKQFEVAMDGNPTMLIWLGRNILNQTDKIEVDVSTIDDSTREEVDDLVAKVKRRKNDTE